MGLKCHCIFGLVLCMTLVPGAMAKSIDFEWKPMVIALGCLAGVLLLIINIIFIVRCCRYCRENDNQKLIEREPYPMRSSQRWTNQYYGQPTPVSTKLRPEVGNALVSPGKKSKRRNSLDDRSDEDDRPPVPPPNRGISNQGFTNLDFEASEPSQNRFPTYYPPHATAATASANAFPSHTATSANAYSSLPREPEPYRPPPAPAMAQPAASGYSDSTMNADIYPDVSVDDYLSGRFRLPSSRLQ